MRFGSSPLARGTCRRRARNHTDRRLIPARAGNILWCSPSLVVVSAHPRSRGEHRANVPVVPCGFGSSPLARGTLAFFIRHITHTRLIPARAGNIAIMTSTSTPAAAHPRSRGEHANSLFIFPRPPGSSPLARGTFLGVFSVIIEFRLIPARAGNIMNVQFSPGALTAHPRSRGEHPLVWLS